MQSPALVGPGVDCQPRLMLLCRKPLEHSPHPAPACSSLSARWDQQQWTV